MSGLSNYAEVAVLNALLNNISLAAGATIYAALHTGDPGEDGSGSVLSDSGYARKAVSFGSPVSGAGTCANDAEVIFNAIADAGPFVVTHFSIWDAVSGGNCLLKGALATGKSFSLDDVPRFPIGALVVTAA